MRFLLLLTLLVAPVFAQDSPEAMSLYNKGVKLLDDGKGEDARKSFETILKDYPSSAYAKLAKEGLAKPLVASIEFVDTKPLSEREIRKMFETANARLRVGRPYNPDDGDEARRLLAQLMLKRKLRAKDITVTAKDLPDRKVDVKITVIH
ncbi:MAG TPA: POTRA domain-containing protein [Bryobacteraceae bacterium]|nr:POTRA domain-containing protein [Bryobacteraceae bacterium]